MVEWMPQWGRRLEVERISWFSSTEQQFTRATNAMPNCLCRRSRVEKRTSSQIVAHGPNHDKSYDNIHKLWIIKHTAPGVLCRLTRLKRGCGLFLTCTWHNTCNKLKKINQKNLKPFIIIWEVPWALFSLKRSDLNNYNKITSYSCHWASQHVTS